MPRLAIDSFKNTNNHSTACGNDGSAAKNDTNALAIVVPTAGSDGWPLYLERFAELLKS